MRKPEQGAESVQTRESLLQGLKLGDENRWQEFYRIYGATIRGFALKSGLTETEADEVVQETCIGVAGKVGEFHYDPSKCRFKTWLLNLASWRVKNQFVKRQRWDDRVHAASGSESSEFDRTAVIERAPDPNSEKLNLMWEEEWRENLLKAALEKVREKFSATQFQVFDLNVMKEWPARDVAKSLGISIASVYLAKHRVSSAIKKEVAVLERQIADQAHQL